jgi:hypothetical protein
VPAIGFSGCGVVRVAVQSVLQTTVNSELMTDKISVCVCRCDIIIFIIYKHFYY